MTERDDAATAEIKLRMKEPLRAKIESAARERGISMNAEMVDRLERSFERPAIVKSLLGEALELSFGSKLAGLLQVVAKAMEDVGHHANFAAHGGPQYGKYREDWLQDPYAFSEAANAVSDVLKSFSTPRQNRFADAASRARRAS